MSGRRQVMHHTSITFKLVQEFAVIWITARAGWVEYETYLDCLIRTYDYTRILVLYRR